MERIDYRLLKIPTPQETFENHNKVDDKLVEWYTNEILSVIPKLKNIYDLAEFGKARTPLNDKTALYISELFAEKGWEIKWRPRHWIRARIEK
jgi:hypothetical protein